MRILNLEGENLSRSARARLAQLGTVEDRAPSLPLPADLSGYEVFTTRFDHRLTSDVLARAPQLQFILTPTTGLDHIDLQAAGQRGIRVISLRGQFEFLRGIWASAEHSWALLLALVRRIPLAVQAPGQGVWAQRPYFGGELARKRIGIVGLGRIGEKVARYAQAFDMTVRAFDPAPKGRTEGIEMVPALNDLLTQSDVLSIHVPLQDDTRRMIGATELSLLPMGALVLNTARGAIVDEAALLAALESGHVGGAAIDVLEGEGQAGFPAEHPLVRYARGRDNVLITPHIGGSTWESREMTELFVIEALARALNEAG